MVTKLLLWVENRFAGKVQFQRMFESMNRISLRGMNYCRGYTVELSGETFALRHVHARLRAQGVQHPVVFDVGANIGQFADVLLSIFGKEITCYSFEPASSTFLHLQAHFKDTPCIITCQNGFGKEEGHIDLYSNQDKSTIASLYPIYDLQSKTVSTMAERITLRTVDNFCAERGIQQIDFLKVDVEGAELDVLLGAANMIAQGQVRFVMFEFGLNNMTARVYMKDFFRVLKDYRIYRIVQNGIRELQYSEYLEVPMYSNYLAERRG